MITVVEQIRAALGDDAVLTSERLAQRARSWIDPAPMAALALVRPRSTSEVSTVLRLCHAAGQAIVAQGGLTNLVESAQTNHAEIALSLERMTAIEEIDHVGQSMTVQAGAPLQAVQEAASQHGLFFPLDLAARGSCTVGGAVSTNAGGVRVLRYGMMREQVLGLEVVLADGTLVTSLNKMLKNNAGYDLKQLFIGAEGTLGVVTRAVLRLWPQPASITTVLAGCQNFKQVTRLLAHVQQGLGALLASFEVMWNEYYRLTTTPPAPTHPPLSQDHPYYVLIEAMGGDPMADRMRVENELEKAFERGLCNDMVVAKSRQQRAGLWRVREDSEQLEKQFSPIYGFDVSLPIIAMEQYVAEVRRSLTQHTPAAMCWVYGHVADGNLHINVWVPAGNAAVRKQVEEIVYRPLAAVGGSVSAEHGIGLEKREYLSWCRSEAEIMLMRRLKAALDPTNILNPGKVFEQR